MADVPFDRGPRYAYPLLVALPGSRRRHDARWIGGGPAVVTLCRKRGTPTGDGQGLAHCATCARTPNPINQRIYQ
jgi:hypothetical protein